jgi:hypothetical protein
VNSELVGGVVGLLWAAGPDSVPVQFLECVSRILCGLLVGSIYLPLSLVDSLLLLTECQPKRP